MPLGVVSRLLKPAPGSFGRGVLTLASGTAGVQALYVVSLPVITRLYAVPQMGDLTVFQALLAILLVISALRYEVAIFVPRDERSSANVLGLAIVVVLLGSVLVAVALGSVALTTTLPERYAVISQHWILLWLGLVGGGTALALTQWTLRRRAFATVAAARVSQVGSQLATQLTLGFVWPGGWGLLVGDVVGRVTGSLTLFRRLFLDDRTLLGGIDRGAVRRAAREYADYPLFSMPGALLNTVTLQLPPLLLAFLFGQHVAGWFGLMIRVVSAPMMLVGKSVSDAYASEFSKLMRENPAALPKLFRSTFRRLALLGLPALVVVSVAGPWLFQLVFGGEWREAGIYARCAAVYTFAEFCCFPLFQTLGLLKLPRIQFAWDTVLISALVAGIWGVWRFGAGPRAAVLYYGFCFGAMYFVHVWISSRMLARATAAQS